MLVGALSRLFTLRGGALQPLLPVLLPALQLHAAMGITGLSKLIADVAPAAVKENEMKNYFGEAPTCVEAVVRDAWLVTVFMLLFVCP